MTRCAGIGLVRSGGRAHAAASGAAAEAGGRAICSGHAAPSGQLSENHRMARSKLPVVRSPPDAMRPKVFPSPKMRVEIPASDGNPSRPLVPVASAYA